MTPTEDDAAHTDAPAPQEKPFLIACRGPGDTGKCGYEGTLDTFPPNLTSVSNAIRCPGCGSTNNAFNSAHGKLMRDAMAGGPVVTEANVLAALKAGGPDA